MPNKDYYIEYLECMSAVAFIRGYVKAVKDNKYLNRETIIEACTKALQKCGLEVPEP